MELIHIALGGPSRRITDARGKTWRFEDHPYCGPVVVDVHDDPKDSQPPEGSPFWEAVTHWAQQGKRLIDGAHGPCCVWDKPTPQKMRHLGGMHYQLVPDDKVPNAEVTSRPPTGND